MKRIIYLVLGGPGSGKGTFCQNIIRRAEPKSIQHISAGELLRKFSKKNEKDIKDEAEFKDLMTVQSYLKESKIVPAEITMNLLRRSIYHMDSTYAFIDGFPRNLENKNLLDQVLYRNKEIQLEGVVYLNCW